MTTTQDVREQAIALSKSHARPPALALDLGSKPLADDNRDVAPLDLGQAAKHLITNGEAPDPEFGQAIVSSISKVESPALDVDPASGDLEPRGTVLGQVVQGQATRPPTSSNRLPDPALSELGALGRNLITATQLRIAAENKVRNLIRDDELTIFIEMEQQHVKKTQAMEADILKQVLALAKTIPYIKEMESLPGVGFKGAAKLVAIAGDPIWHSRDERLRTSGEWRAVLGMTPDSKHSMGTGSNPHPARPVLWNMAKGVVRAGIRRYCAECREYMTAKAAGAHGHETVSALNPEANEGIRELAQTYLNYKERASSRVHTRECGRCGVRVCKYEDCTEGGSLRAPHAGHARAKIKAGAGDPLSPGHIEARAIRLLMSEFADLFYRVRRDGV